MAAFDGGVHAHASTTGQTVHYLGAAAALAIFAGIGVWSYDLIKRDVSGIPVVRAVEGDMRVLPENPGGEIALHTGLSVNEVAAEGEAAELSERLVLAPATPDLADEDLVISPTAEEGEVAPLELVEETAVPVVADAGAAPTLSIEAEPMRPEVRQITNAADLQALAAELAEGVEPLGEVAAGTDAPPVLRVDGADTVQVIATTVPGVTKSLRPVVRPGSPVAAAIAAATNIAPPAAPDPVAIAAGTNLVQLGAFPTEADADAAWTVLKAQFGDFMVNKDPVILAADSGGSTFYRLRAMGFDDLTDARRFCAALEAGAADCIPVVVR